MAIKQISVFLENKAGRLAEVTKVLADAKINLRATTIADTADFGILRLIVDKEEETLKLLEQNGFTAKETEVIGIEVEDTPGGLYAVMSMLEKNGVNVEYLYATLEKKENKAVVVFKVGDIKKGMEIVCNTGLKCIDCF
ncbi:MAG: ACT domain-containing protein [Spirochaetales bacterium]|nr:ACT domain-containing protein [Spirochaetales bacterium]